MCLHVFPKKPASLLCNKLINMQSKDTDRIINLSFKKEADSLEEMLAVLSA